MTKKSDTGPKSLPASFFELIEHSETKYGICAYIPLLFSVCCFLPLVIIEKYEFNFENKISSDEFVSFHTSLLVFSGIIAAFSISSINHIMNLTSKYPFSDYLMEEKLFNSFVFYPQFVFIIQCALAVFSVIFICSHFIFDFNEPNRFRLVLFSSGYAVYMIIRTVGLLGLMRLLNWHFARYEIMYNED